MGSLNYIYTEASPQQKKTPCQVSFSDTGDERIELPLKVLETLVIPFDQSPMDEKISKMLTHLRMQLFIYTIRSYNCQVLFIFIKPCLICQVKYSRRLILIQLRGKHILFKLKESITRKSFFSLHRPLDQRNG